MGELTKEMILAAVGELNKQLPEDGQINTEGGLLSVVELFLDAVEGLPVEEETPKSVTDVFNVLVEVEAGGTMTLENFCSGLKGEFIEEKEEEQEEGTDMSAQGKVVEEKQEKSDPKYNDIILPDIVEDTVLSEDQSGWEYDYAVNKCRNLFQTVREGGVDLVLEFLKAHEMLVNKKVEGKTWGAFCDEVGISTQTAVNWFDKYSLPFTKISGPERKEEAPPEKKKTMDKKKEKKNQEEKKQEKKKEKGDNRNPRISSLVEAVDFCTTELGALSSGKIEIATADKENVNKIIKAGPAIIVCLHKLGVNVKKVHDTLIKPTKG